MRLYHLAVSLFIPVLVSFFSLLTGCTAPQVTQGMIVVNVIAGDETITVEVPPGSSVEDVLTVSGLALGSLDRVEPAPYMVLDDGSNVRLIRVEEEFNVEQVVIPFEHQVLRNESLPEGQEYWLQLGQNGLQEITVRQVFEDGVEVSSSRVKSVVIKEPLPQIKMVGVQKPFEPISIPGRLVYLLDGNAWLMEGSTSNRRQVVTTGDLDGRVFSLSPDGNWLLFTRQSQVEDTINRLWTIRLDGDPGRMIDLKVANIVHFAAWKPGSALTVAFSTVEPRLAAPGWQANNDLGQLSFAASGFLNPVRYFLEANQGGVYGWWGTDFAWAPDGFSLAYSRPDGVGLLDLQTGLQETVLEIEPLQTFADWAWVPGFAWGPDGKVLYTVDYQSQGDAQLFDLVAIPIEVGNPLPLVSQVGMFAYPAASPLREIPSGETAYQVAYLQALFPSQSETSRYRLMVMDRDGSNRRSLFPLEGTGLTPQRIVWSPQSLDSNGDHAIAFLFQDNLWLVNATNGETWQITGDNLTSRLDWK